jgi:hypothetical protein
LLLNIGTRVLMVLAVSMLVVAGAAAGDGSGRRGEMGVQIGARWLDRDFVPDHSRGVNMTLGLEGAWSLNQKWALFGDVNRSKHDSIEMCGGAEGCYARTPVVRINALTVGIERRLAPGPRGGQWLLGLGTGIEDLRWNGIRIHHGMLSLNFSRRVPIGPGAARLTLRADTSFSGRTDNQIKEVLDNIRITTVSVLVGWDFGFGGRL